MLKTAPESFVEHAWQWVQLGGGLKPRRISSLNGTTSQGTSRCHPSAAQWTSVSNSGNWNQLKISDAKSRHPTPIDDGSANWSCDFIKKHSLSGCNSLRLRLICWAPNTALGCVCLPTHFSLSQSVCLFSSCCPCPFSLLFLLFVFVPIFGHRCQRYRKRSAVWLCLSLRILCSANVVVVVVAVAVSD